MASPYSKPRDYELMIVLVPEMADDDASTAVDTVLGYITQQNGTINRTSTDSPWGRRRLAYSIRHEGTDYRDGFYVLTYFSALPDAVSEIERELKLDTKVIRYLLLIEDPRMGEKLPEPTEVPAGEEAEAAEPPAADEPEVAEAPAADEPEAAEAEEIVEQAEAPVEEAETPAAKTETDAPTADTTTAEDIEVVAVDEEPDAADDVVEDEQN